MTNDEIREIAEKAASMAVHQTFSKFGVDTNSQESVNEFRSDLVFARELRKTTKSVQRKILVVVVSAIALGALAVMAKGFGFSPK